MGGEIAEREGPTLTVVHLVSIFLEAVIVVVALLLALNKRKIYGYGFALTFAIYVVYDLANQFQLAISGPALIAIFFVATLSALLSLLRLYWEV